MHIGKIIKSNAHTDYVCQVYSPGEVKTPPSPTDYAFGTFVRIPLDTEQGHLVGVIYDTVLVNPDFGNLGPRLSPAPDLAVFSPDYLAEKVTLVGITAVGMLSLEGAPTHGVPAPRGTDRHAGRALGGGCGLRVSPDTGGRGPVRLRSAASGPGEPAGPALAASHHRAGADAAPGAHGSVGRPAGGTGLADDHHAAGRR